MFFSRAHQVSSTDKACNISRRVAPFSFQVMDGPRATKEMVDRDMCWRVLAKIKVAKLWNPTDSEDRGSSTVLETHLKQVRDSQSQDSRGRYLMRLHFRFL